MGWPGLWTLSILFGTRHSMAHPGEELLYEPEALGAVNAVKSLLYYVNTKLR